MTNRRKPTPAPDPARAANAKVLEDRRKRMEEEERNKPAPLDLGLDLKEEPEATNAVEFLQDEFDRKNFGEEVPTYTRIIYGPDPLLTASPELRNNIDAVGLERYADATFEAIMKFGEKAVPDPLMRKALARALAKFGTAEVAAAFRERILKIPRRTVEVEADRGMDEVFGKPLDDAVKRYGRPGMAVKFLSDRCNGALGMRGYVIVKDERGDPVKVGTLYMGEIPQRVADARQRHWAEESEAVLREMEESYLDKQEKLLSEAAGLGVRLDGARALRPDEIVRANATESEEFLGQQRPGGVRIQRGE